MSAITTTVALASTSLLGAALGPATTCPTCGREPDHHPVELTRRRVKDLEGQVQFLNTQAVQMAEKLAEYEEEVRRLRAQTVPPATATYTPRNGSSISSTATSAFSARSNHERDQSQSPPAQQQSRFSSLASLLPYRRPSTAGSQQQHAQAQTQTQTQTRTQSQSSVATSPPPHSALPTSTSTSTPRPSLEDAIELQNALNREQTLRKAAENQLSQANTELEELTAQLFSQANEMVAQERKARARLEERVAVLERRDIEKRTRLERLEKAMERVERIRALVG